MTASILFGCTRGGVFTSGENEEKPGAGANQSQAATAGNISIQDIPIAHATFFMTVITGESTNPVCSGMIRFTFSSGFNLKPLGTLLCAGFYKLDMAKMLAGYSGEYMKDDMSKYPEFGMVVRMPNPANPDMAPTFTPPRPDRIGPLIQNDAEFNNYLYTEQTEVSYLDPKKKRVRDSGTWTIKVHSINGTIQPTGYTGPEVFDDVIHWEKLLDGLDLGPKGDLGAFDSMEYFFNVRPIRVPKILIHTTVRDAVGLSIPIIKNIKLTIELNLRRWESLNSPDSH